MSISSDSSATAGLHRRIGLANPNPVDCIMEREPSTSQPAHDGAHGHSEYFSCLLVGEAVHANHCYQRTLLGSDLIETAQHLSESEAILCDSAPITIARKVILLDMHAYASTLCRTLPIEPLIERNATHPTV
jgi:hypothetical protein